MLCIKKVVYLYQQNKQTINLKNLIMNQSRVEKLEQRVLTLEKILLMFPIGGEATKEERGIMSLIIETKKELKLQTYQD